MISTRRAHASAAATLAASCGYRLHEAAAHRVRASIELAANDPPQAIRYARLALSLESGVEHRAGQARTLVVLGLARQRHGEPSAARDDWQRAGELFVALGLPEAKQVNKLLAEEPGQRSARPHPAMTVLVPGWSPGAGA